MHEFFGEVIHSYTRAEALEDGVLVDVSQRASEAGFIVPVAITAGVWADVNDIPNKQSHQDVGGRLWDLLFMAVLRCRMKNGGTDIQTDGLLFSIIMHVGRATYYRAKVHIGPGDSGEPVATIMRINED